MALKPTLLAADPPGRLEGVTGGGGYPKDVPGGGGVDAKSGRACPIGVGPGRGAQYGGTAAAVPDRLLRRYNGVLHALRVVLIHQDVTFCDSNRIVQKVTGLVL